VASLRNILFALAPDQQSVLIGPVHLTGAAGKAPRLLDKGGTSIRESPRRSQAYTVTHPPRPYSMVALRKAVAKLKTFWRDAVKGTGRRRRRRRG